MRRYWEKKKERLMEDKQKKEDVKLRVQKSRKKKLDHQKSLEEDTKQRREKDREQKQAERKKLSVDNLPNGEAQSSQESTSEGFPNRMAKCRSLQRVKKVLPESRSQKASVVKALLDSPCTGTRLSNSS